MSLRQKSQTVFPDIERIKDPEIKQVLSDLFKTLGMALTDSFDDVNQSSRWEIDGTETQLETADEIDMQSKKIMNVADPVNAQDAVTKNFFTTNRNIKIGTFTRDLTAASGTVSISVSGLTVAPSVVLIFGAKSQSTYMSLGISDGTNKYVVFFHDNGASWDIDAGSTIAAGSGADNQVGVANNFSTTGFDIVWTKTGAPTGTFTGFYLILS